jgi:predicted nucleotidyltransferase
MLDRIEQNRKRIAELCSRHGVRRLDLFGSAARGDFDPARSDVDFFVEFVSYENPKIADHWFGLQEDLQELLGCTVDLTSLRMAKNPIFLENANRHKITLYAA